MKTLILAAENKQRGRQFDIPDLGSRYRGYRAKLILLKVQKWPDNET